MKIVIPVLFIFLGLSPGTLALAQDYGALVGVQQTDVQANNPAASQSGKVNYKAGALVTFDFLKDGKLRTGLIYDQRHVNLTYTAFPTLVYEYNLDYLDVPVNFEYDVFRDFWIYGGLTFAINTSTHVVSPGSSGPTPTVDPVSLMGLLDLGLTHKFCSHFGVDIYYQRGLGQVIDKYQNYSIYGADFIYWL